MDIMIVSQMSHNEFLSKSFEFGFFERNSLFRRISDKNQQNHIISKMGLIRVYFIVPVIIVR